MKIKILVLALILTVTVMPFMTGKVESAPNNYGITEVNHTVEVMYNGDILVNDTLQIEGDASDGILMGLPSEYGSHVLHVFAYHQNDVFPVSLDVPLDNRDDFYGVEIEFPDGTPQVFSVSYILSQNLLIRESSNVSRLSFPVYPSLTQTAEVVNGAIELPSGSEYLNGTVEDLTYTQESLAAYTSSPGNVTFSPPEDGIPKFDVTQLNRKIRIGLNGLQISDTYRIANRGLQPLSSIELVLSENASLQKAYDLFKRPLQEVSRVSGLPNRYQVSFTLETGESRPVESGDSYVFTVEYLLPEDSYVLQEEPTLFQATLPMFQNLEFYIPQSSITFVLPEGGHILNFMNTANVGDYSVERDLFQETLTFHKEHGFSVNSFNLILEYEYNILWASFRPTLWMITLTLIGGVVALIWKRKPKPTVTVALPEVKGEVSSKVIQAFVDAYERKRKLKPKLESLETRAKKGKISRRRYKVRKKTLETKLDTLSRNLDELGNKLKAAGGRYRNLMDRMEVAETEINEVGSNIASIKARHRCGDLSLGAYRKLLSEYEERKEKAETTINRILIRLREEIH